MSRTAKFKLLYVAVLTIGIAAFFIAQRALELMHRARELGYIGATSDRLAHVVSGVLARIEGGVPKNAV